MKNLYNLNDWTDVTEHQKIGEILLTAGKINLSQLGAALDLQKVKNIPIGQILLEIKSISETDLNAALELQDEIDEFITLYNKKSRK